MPKKLVTRVVVSTTLAACAVIATATGLFGSPLSWYVACGGIVVACAAVIAAAHTGSKPLVALALLALLGCSALAVRGIMERHTAPDDVFEGFGPNRRAR